MSDGGINRSNAETVFQALKTMDEVTRENQLMLMNMSKLMTDLMQRVVTLEQEAVKQRIAALGTGPTDNGNLDQSSN